MSEVDSAPVFNLRKGAVFNLAKIKPGITDFHIGLNWDPAATGVDIDLDAVLVAVGEDGKVVPGQESESFLFYQNNGRDSSPPKAFQITEDNRSGVDSEDGADDEAISIYTGLIHSSVKRVKIYITFHEPGDLTLTDVDNVSLSVQPLIDGQPDKVADTSVLFTVDDIKDCLGAHMADLIPNPAGGWDIVAVGEACGDLSSVAASNGLVTEG